MLKLLRQIFYFVCLRILTAYYIIQRKLRGSPPVVADPIEEYTRLKKQKLLGTYKTDIDVNANIEKVIYNSKELKQILRDVSNPLEPAWKSRLLYESTPRGTVIMYYDIYKQGFAYYSDQNCIPYAVLNAVAMKYVLTFFCRDFFMDEETITTEHLSKIFDEPEDKPKPEKKPITKFKQYRSTEPLPNKTNKDKEKEPVKTFQKNKFISTGKIYDFKITQKKINKLKSATQYDDMFNKNISYKSFKNRAL